MITLIIFTLIGLVFNIIGTLLIYSSVIFTSKTRFYYDSDGKKDYVEADQAIFKKRRSKWGVYTLITGFIVQLLVYFYKLILS